MHQKRILTPGDTMSLTVKNISVIYTPINETNTFTSGDVISGQVLLDVEKDTQIQSLSVKIKGKARVSWSEHYGKTTVVYSDKEKYYSMEMFFVREDKTNGNDHNTLKDPSGQLYPSVVAPGHHVYPFSFQLPLQHFPPTFKSAIGKIAYTLETKLSRSMRVSSKAKAEFHYVSSQVVSSPELMVPQYGSKEKKMKLFPSGNVSMDISTEKMGYYLGEGLKVLAEVQNNLSRAIKLKYCLYEKHTFFAKGRRKLHTHDLFKEEGETIEPNSKNTVTKVLSIPPSLTISILNCKVINVEYRLRVYLDVPYASDPEVKFPVVVLPLQSGPGAKSATNSDFGIWNQPPGGNLNPSPLQMPPSGQFGASSSYYGPPLSPFPAPGFPGPPDQFAPPSYVGAPGQFGHSVSRQNDASDPPPYQEHQLYPQLPDHSKKS
ncbi:arrestin domain-containing protein 3-like [Pimephales promelas]|uniref:arrestin domain-containing protein 3-like n=1 Tax=Pimephales promelas TaxID=90988 RepID=UPI001955D1A7|nr:arrestin domain-containing protein 3-like [Pimephales promelas]